MLCMTAVHVRLRDVIIKNWNLSFFDSLRRKPLLLFFIIT